MQDCVKDSPRQPVGHRVQERQQKEKPLEFDPLDPDSIRVIPFPDPLGTVGAAFGPGVYLTEAIGALGQCRRGRNLLYCHGPSRSRIFRARALYAVSSVKSRSVTRNEWSESYQSPTSAIQRSPGVPFHQMLRVLPESDFDGMCHRAVNRSISACVKCAGGLLRKAMSCTRPVGSLTSQLTR